jgi:tryptophan-rich sensory protein
MVPARSFARQWFVLGALVLVTFCASLAGMAAPPGDWYASLAKPAWNPPGWIFGPVWTALYLMMAVAAWLVWRREGWRSAVWWYFLQLALNAAWTPVFFGAQRIGWALVVMVALWLAILATLRAFLRVSRPAGLLLFPYLGWVTFAMFLNFTLWRMNPG